MIQYKYSRNLNKRATIPKTGVVAFLLENMQKDILDEYELVSDEARILTEYLVKVHEKLGTPNIVDSETAWKMVDEIVRVWGGFYVEERENLAHDLEIEIKYERPVRDAIKKEGGYTKVVWPPKLFSMIRVFFPEQKMMDKRFTDGFIKRYPQFQGTGHKIV